MNGQPGLLCLVYVSRATRPMSDDDLLALLRQARRKNDGLQVTGLLLCKDGHFMQALEGPPADVMTLYSIIMSDPRHTDVTTLIKFRTEARAFDGWSMGFTNVDRIPEIDRQVFTPFLQESFVPSAWQQAPHRAVRLLLAFRDAGSLVEV